jgi:signal transduction histidine kinase
VNGLSTRSISGRLMLGFAMVGALSSALVVALIAGVAERYGEARLRQEIAQGTERLARMLEGPLWDVDLDGAQSLGEAFASDPRVVRVTIRESVSGATRTIERSAVVDTLFHRQTVRHHGRAIGEVGLSFDRGVYRTLIAREVEIASAIALIALVASLIGVRLLLRRLLERPLGELSSVVSSYAAGDYTRAASAIGSGELREFGEVLDAMGTRIKGQVRDLQDLNATLERRVEERTTELVAAVQELESFSYSVSHDLRAPLRAIDGFGRMLEEDHAPRLDDEGRRLLAVVRRSTQGMAQLIDDLLRFSRAGRHEMARVRVDMTQLARDAWSSLASPEQLATVSFRLAPLPEAEADPALTRQVWANLLSNALKFSRGRPEPTVEVGSHVEAGRAVYFVRDNGVGFDPRYTDKLFGVFQRLHSVNEFEGTGVGLALVQRIVTRHGGAVWADGALGEGATFSFTIPFKRDS